MTKEGKPLDSSNLSAHLRHVNLLLWITTAPFHFIALFDLRTCRRSAPAIAHFELVTQTAVHVREHRTHATLKLLEGHGLLNGTVGAESDTTIEGIDVHGAHERRKVDDAVRRIRCAVCDRFGQSNKCSSH